MRDVTAVEISTSIVRGGMAGRPLQFLSIQDEIVTRLRDTQLTWTLCEGRWSIDRIFEEQPVQIVRVLSP